MDLRLISGFIGQDAQLNVIPSTGRKVINFSVAISKGYTDKNGNKVNNTVWVSCSKYLGQNDSEKLVPHLTKGKGVIVKGEPDFRVYDQKDGTPAVDQRLIVDNIEFMPMKKAESREPTMAEKEAAFNEGQ